jgi:hypothetical protein
MAIDDHSELAFELILQPSALNSKLLSRQKNVNETGKIIQNFPILPHIMIRRKKLLISN